MQKCLNFFFLKGKKRELKMNDLLPLRCNYLCIMHTPYLRATYLKGPAGLPFFFLKGERESNLSH